MNPIYTLAWVIIALTAIPLLAFMYLFADYLCRLRRWEKRTREWRKNIKVGDRAIFKSMSGNVSGDIVAIERTGKFRFETHSVNGKTTSWRSPEELWIYDSYFEGEE
jgi:hypothetical protein